VVAAAALPMRRADEPLTLVRAADDILARRGEPALATLRRALVKGGRGLPDGEAALSDGDGEEEEGEGAPPPPPPRAEAASALAVALLATLRGYLVAAYGLTPDRVAGFAASGERRKAEERAHASARGAPLSLDALPAAVLAPGAAPAAGDDAWWGIGRAALAAARAAVDAAAAAAPAASRSRSATPSDGGDTSVGPASPSGGPSPRGRGRGRGRAAPARGRGRGRGRGRAGAKRRAASSSSDDDGGSDASMPSLSDGDDD